ncbi:MAG TPA: Tn3 family transposase, partial [Dermatophilaceae bacterium]
MGGFPRTRPAEPSTAAPDARVPISSLPDVWNLRASGPGVMIYWHVERKSVCIYSQLKSCSSSEVAAMLEGLLRHMTDAEID